MKPKVHQSFGDVVFGDVGVGFEVSAVEYQFVSDTAGGTRIDDAEAAALVGETAMICGESVLAMHNLALVNPARVHVAVRRRLRKELPDWIETEKATAEMTEDNFNGIPCQKLSEVIRQSRGKILTERLVSAVREAGSRGLLDIFEYDALKKEFPV